MGIRRQNRDGGLIIEAFETGLYHLTGYTIQTLYTGVNLCLCGFRGKPCFL